MPKTHPDLKTLEEFCKYYEQDNEIAKQRLFRVYQIAMKEIERKRGCDRRRYYRLKEKQQEEPPEEPQPQPEPEKVPEPTAPLPTIQEEEPAPIPKVKRNSFTIPMPSPGSLVQHSIPAAQFPTIISDTKKIREVKRAPSSLTPV
jgi:hypothetical protein